jgi:redox-sensitive bicupin YhaK (pirin superfamily)
MNAPLPAASTGAAATLRPVQRTIRGMATSDGAGVKLTRVIGGPALSEFDPFLLFDEFRSDSAGDYIAGFPDHPHRGFETVTYMLAGRMRHRDNQGNSGLLTPGSVQWMTAGRGIVHSEMPEQENGLMAGFQLWVNLPARDKMIAPRYQDIPPEQVPSLRPAPGVTLRLLAGRLGDVDGPVNGIEGTQPLYVDVQLAAGARAALAVPATHNAFAYVYEGAARIGGAAQATSRGELAQLGAGDRFEAEAADGPSRLVLVAGRPLGEPVARYGPFVMNTREEIMQAFADFQAGRF